jgi:hypothetical protein
MDNKLTGHFMGATSIGTRRTPKFAWVGVAVAIVVAPPVLAQQERQLLPLLPGPLPTDYGLLLELPEAEFPGRFWFGAGLDFGHDNNVFRGADTLGNSNSSWLTRLYGQVNMALPVGRQRFLAQLTVSDYRFSDLSYLDYTAPEFRGAWLWQAGNDWQGEVTYNHLQSIAPFIDTPPYFKNVQTLDYATANAEYALTPRWRVGGGVIGYQASNSADEATGANVRQFTGEIGVRYLATEQNYIRFFGAFSNGNYYDRTPTPDLDDEYTQIDAGLDVFYGVTDISFLRGRVGYTSRQYPDASARDFSGPTGRLDFIWGISPKTSIDFNVRREIGVFETIASNYYATTAVGVAPHWEISPKLRFEAAYEHWWRDYYGDAVVDGFVLLRPQRKDQLNFARAGFIWTPTHNWLLRLGVQWSDRDSTWNEFDFSNSTVVFGTVQFGF